MDNAFGSTAVPLLRGRVAWIVASAFSTVLLSLPAVWNGFPLLQYDTGGYLARWYEGYLVPSRSVIYGLFLAASAPLSFWPVVLGQSALTVWIIALTLRAHRLGGRPGLLVGMVAALCAVTTLPWLTAILLTDIFAALSVIALYLLTARAAALSRFEWVTLCLLVSFSAATHSATFAVLLAMLAGAGILSMFDRKRLPLARLATGGLALALGAALVFAANAIIAKRFVWTPGGFALSFGRMLQDGIVQKYLAEHCAHSRFILCAYKDELPRDADEWFWGSALFDKLGRFSGMDEEMRQIVLGSLSAYPLLQLETALIATRKQLLDVHTGEGVINSIWHTYGIVDRYTPKLAKTMRAARQQHGDINFGAINRLHYPIALTSLALLPLLMWYALRRRGIDDIGEFLAACLFSIVANAFICGALSNPHDRYGARIIWIAVLSAVMTAVRVYEYYLRAPADLAISATPLHGNPALARDLLGMPRDLT
ncbi:MAG TPA: hypothetical protein VFP60_03860 [Pseudolabrys sp.]|nr:hypothetical protein [Pseudolabrys sp.]